MQCTIFEAGESLTWLPPHDEKVDSLGGYRLIRRLGVGSRSDVWLGSDGSETAAIKVFREGVSRDRIDNEIEALGRVSGRHLLRLEDLAMGPDAVPCLILQRLSQWNLGRLLATAKPSDGAAVTILAPLCLAVAELHRLGVSHGRIHGGSILFDEEGAPVLASFGAAETFSAKPDAATGVSVSPALLTQQSAVAADLESLANTCLSTLDAASDVAQWLSTSHDRDHAWFASELADRLFSFARAAPVSFAVSVGVNSPAPIPSRLASRPRPVRGQVANEPLSEGEMSRSFAASHPLATSMAAFLHLPDGMVNTLFESSHRILERGPLSSFIHRSKKVLGPVRKPVWIMAAVVASGVVVAAALLPSNGAGNDGLSPQVSPPPTATSVVPPVSVAILGEDPLAAATALLDARDECFTARSVLCFDSVDQQGSAAMDSDSTQVRLLQDGGAIDGSLLVSTGSPEGSSTSQHLAVSERLGDSVLLTVSLDSGGDEPHVADGDGTDANGSEANPTRAASFSLLIIKSDEGWRIRDLVPLMSSAY